MKPYVFQAEKLEHFFGGQTKRIMELLASALLPDADYAHPEMIDEARRGAQEWGQNKPKPGNTDRTSSDQDSE